MSCWDRVEAAGTIAVSLVSFMGGSQIPYDIVLQVCHEGFTKVISSGTLNNGVASGLPVPHGTLPQNIAGPFPFRSPIGGTVQPLSMAVAGAGYCRFV